MSDLYSSYAELSASEREGRDYRIHSIDRDSPIVIVAPHGGRIEPGTLEIARLLAADDLSLYCFESLSARRLHITSSRFDEPKAIALIEKSEIAVAVHGRADGGDARTIWMGGRHANIRDAVGAALERVGFRTSTDHHMQGKHPGNICNRGRLRAGVQIELPRSLRNGFRSDASARGAFVAAVRSVIDTAGALTQTAPEPREL